MTNVRGTMRLSSPMRIISCLFTTSSFTVARAWKANNNRFDPNHLLNAAKLARARIPSSPPSVDDDLLAFPSTYDNGKGMRGFCNWLLPGRIMIGQYPGCTPERNGPSQQEVEQHIESIVKDAGISLFCCLQSEVPCQSDYKEWEKKEGKVFLDEYLRGEFPFPFTHYAPIVSSVVSTSTDNVEQVNENYEYLHYPIEDLSIPNSQPVQDLLTKLLHALSDDKTIYLHCWGGRGRAGMVGAMLMALLYPQLDARAALDLVQSGYDCRAGSAEMPYALSKSPQTEQQRQFVRAFIDELGRQWGR